MNVDLPPNEAPAVVEIGPSALVDPAKSSVPTGFVLAVVALGLLAVVAIMLMHNATPAASSDSAAVTALQAEYQALREEHNKERVAMGLRPIEGQSEPIDDIATRLKKDSDSLVALANGYQNLMDEKELELNARSAEILRGEKLRTSLISENARLQAEMRNALSSSSDLERLRQDLADTKSRYDAVTTELVASQEKLRTLNGTVSQDDYTDLQRRLAETQRAKEFFEARVKELEAGVSK